MYRPNGFTRRLSGSRSSLDGALIGSQLAEQLSSRKNVNSNTAIRSIQSRVPAKPLIIHTGNGPYLGLKYFNFFHFQYIMK